MKQRIQIMGIALPLTFAACMDRQSESSQIPATDAQAFGEEGERLGEPSGAEFEAQGPSQQPRGVEATYMVELAPEIVMHCEGLGDNKLFFQNDTSKVSAEDKERLEKVARCVTDGPLQGQKLAVIGFAAPQGSADFNYQLGGQRAQSVAKFLEQSGVERENLATVSMGELFASTEDRRRPEFDRRVVLRLAEEPPQ